MASGETFGNAVLGGSLDTHHSPLDTDMVPWPIALLALFYGLLAAVTGATVWKIVTGTLQRSIVWPAAWLILSLAVVCGLPLLKPWARRLAVVGSAGLGLVTLGVALLVAGAGRPGLGLIGALLAGTHLIVIRYLRRPVVKAYFSRPVSDTYLIP